MSATKFNLNVKESKVVALVPKWHLLRELEQAFFGLDRAEVKCVTLCIAFGWLAGSGAVVFPVESQIGNCNTKVVENTGNDSLAVAVGAETSDHVEVRYLRALLIGEGDHKAIAVLPLGLPRRGTYLTSTPVGGQVSFPCPGVKLGKVVPRKAGENGAKQ